MADQTSQNTPLSEEELQDLVASSDAGARAPVGPVGTMLAIIAVIWSLFQVILASPLANYILPGDMVIPPFLGSFETRITRPFYTG